MHSSLQKRNALRRYKSQGLTSRSIVLLWIAAFGLVGFDGQTTADPQARASFHATIDPVVDALWSAFDERAALDHVRFISQYWRLPGNTGYNASLDRIRDRLVSAGFAANASATAPRVVVEEYANSGHAWEYTTGTVAIVRPGAQDEIALSRDKDRLALCINSFSTAPEGVVARLVDVGAGRDADYLGKDLKGAVALGDAETAALWRKAVVEGGAIGVISTALPSYLDADPPGATVRTPRDRVGHPAVEQHPVRREQKGLRLQGHAARGRAAPARVDVQRRRRGTVGPRHRCEHFLHRARTLADRGDSRADRARRADRDRCARAGAGRKRQRERRRHRSRDGCRPGEVDSRRTRPAAVTHPHVPLHHRDRREPAMAAEGGSATRNRRSQACQVHVFDGHDRRGRDEDGRHVSYRAFPGSRGRLGSAMGSAHPVGTRQRQGGEPQRRPDHRRAPGSLPTRREEDWLGRENEPLRRRERSHRVWRRRGSLGSRLALHRPLLPHQLRHAGQDEPCRDEERRSGRGRYRLALRVGHGIRGARRGASSRLRGEARLAREQTDGATLPSADLVIPAWRKWYAEAVRSADRLVVGAPSADFAGRLRTLAAPFDSPSR